MRQSLNFSLTQLEYVQAVARLGHFGKAAESCNVTQPTLSMQIQKLEDHLGVTIFDRSKKPILLTPVGQLLLSQIQSILTEAQKIDGIIKNSLGRGIHGSLTVGVIPTVAPYLLPRLLPVMTQIYPDVTLDIIELQTSQIIEHLDNDQIDVGLLAIPLKVPQIHEVSLFFEPFSVLCHRDHELAPQKKLKAATLKHRDIWLLEEGHCLRHQVLDVCSLRAVKDAKRQFNFESGSLETLKNLVSSYGGYTLLPALAAEQIGSGVKLIPFERPIPAREVGLAFRREHFKIQLIEALKTAVLAGIPEEIKRLKQRDLDVVPV